MKPQLRFKEFTDEWEEKKLGEIFQYQKEKINIDYDFDKYVSTENLLSDFRGVKFPNYSNENKATKFQQNDILMGNIRPYLNKIWLANCDGGASNDVNIFKVFDLYDVQFVYHLVANERFTNKVMLTATGTKMPRGDKKAILEFQYHIPSLLEQEKIGKFFSLLDQRIEKQERKVALLKEEKKGYMQKLFKQELRFKDEQGKDYPAWEEKKLGFILKVNSGKDYKKLNAGNIKVYGTGGVISTVDNYLSDEDGIGIGRKGTIDKPMYLKAPFWTVDTLFYCLTNQNKYFIYYLFQTISWKKYDESTGVPSLSKKNIENIKIQLPSLSEQEKIAKFLTLLDQRIEKEQEKLKLMKEEKQGLAQKLFI